MEDLTYYLEENHEDQRWYDWFNHTVSGLTEEIEQTSRRLLAESHDPRRLYDYDESEVLSMESKIKHLSRDVRGRRLGLSVDLNFAQKRVMIKYSSSRFKVYLKASPGRFQVGGDGCYSGVCVEGRVDVSFPTNGGFSNVRGVAI